MRQDISLNPLRPIEHRPRMIGVPGISYTMYGISATLWLYTVGCTPSISTLERCSPWYSITARRRDGSTPATLRHLFATAALAAIVWLYNGCMASSLEGGKGVARVNIFAFASVHLSDIRQSDDMMDESRKKSKDLWLILRVISFYQDLELPVFTTLL